MGLLALTGLSELEGRGGVDPAVAQIFILSETHTGIYLLVQQHWELGPSEQSGPRAQPHGWECCHYKPAALAPLLSCPPLSGVGGDTFPQLPACQGATLLAQHRLSGAAFLPWIRGR